MKLLIDTHIFIWALFDREKLGGRISKALQTSEQVHISTITFWEIALKVGIGKLRLPRTKPAELPALAKKSGFEISAPAIESYTTFNELPMNNHRDPFDRMLVWQAICEKYTLVTNDGAFAEYHKARLKIFN